MSEFLFCARHYHGGPVALAPPCPWCRIEALTEECDSARANARVLAHAYRHDSRPPDEAVREALDYPVENKGSA